jgi:hypothetical protein
MKDEPIVDRNLFPSSDKAVFVNQALAIRDVSPQNIEALCRTVIGIHADPNTYHRRTLPHHPFRFVHQAGADAAPPNVRKHIEVLNLRNVFCPEWWVIGPPVDGHVAAENVVSAESNKNGALRLFLFGQVALVLRRGLVPADHFKGVYDRLNITCPKQAYPYIQVRAFLRIHLKFPWSRTGFRTE